MLLQDTDEAYDGDADDGETGLPPARGLRRTMLIPFALLALFAVIIGSAVWLVSNSNAVKNRAVAAGIFAPPPRPQPEALDQRLKDLTPEQALLANAEIKLSGEPVEPARAFVVPGTEAMAFSRQSAVNCLTAAVYYEAASESDQGQRSVAQVVLNRVRHPAFPKSVCEVVFQGSERQTGCQFSFTCDGSLARKPSQAGWDRAARVAELSLSGLIEPTVGMATHYHTIWILPYWASSLDKITTVGAHIFYRWKGYWGQRSAFSGNYAGEIFDPTASAMPIDTAAGDLPGLLLGNGQTEAGGTIAGPSAIAPPALVQDQHDARLHSDRTGPALQADEGNQKPTADEANGVLVGPDTDGASGN
jgi:spore germination cell wall hydrolase CwlJ-like protein